MNNILLFCVLVNCQALPYLEHQGRILANNSFIYYRDISVDNGALKCVTNNVNCCNDSDIGIWSDECGTEVTDVTSCLYVTREYKNISLNRNRSISSCELNSVGMWRCDIPDSDDEMKSLYIYISSSRLHGRS